MNQAIIIFKLGLGISDGDTRNPFNTLPSQGLLPTARVGLKNLGFCFTPSLPRWLPYDRLKVPSRSACVGKDCKGSQIHPHNRVARPRRVQGPQGSWICPHDHTESRAGTALESAMREHGNYHAKSKP